MKRFCQAVMALTAAALLTSCATTNTGRSQYLVNAGSNQVEVIAEGRGPLIVLLPSSARSAGDFDEVAGLIAVQGFRVLRLEPRGCGRTSGAYQGISLQDTAHDVAAVIRHENNGPAILVGHAGGSFIARRTAVDYPELVQGVVLAAAAARRYPPELGAAVRKMEDTDLSEQERLQYLRQAFFAPGKDASVWLSGWCRLIQYGTGGTPDNSTRNEWWGSGNKPVLEIQAEDDPFKPVSAWDEYKTEFGDRVSVVRIPNASHALFPEQPRLVAREIVKWTRATNVQANRQANGEKP